MPFLLVRDNDAPPVRVELTGLIVIGRNPDCELQLKEPHASRRHAEVFQEDDVWFVRDLNTRNGTRVNGSNVQVHHLHPGDRIIIGKSAIEFQDTEAPAPSDHIGGYDILEELARSSYARVCRVVRPNSSGREMLMKVFEREAFGPGIETMLATLRLLTTVSHPAIASIHEFNPRGANPYVIREYVHGCALADILSSKGPLAVEDAVNIAIEAAEGLSAAHSRGIVHGNLKPRNILIDLPGNVKLVDFGGICPLSVPEGPLPPMQGFAGIPYYIAPEQIQRAPVDLRADIYSLGAVLYSMLCGTPVFSGSSDENIMDQHLSNQPDDPRSKRPEIPDYLARAIMVMLSKNPADRYQSMQEVLSGLRGENVNTQPAPKVAPQPRAGAGNKAAAKSQSPVRALSGGILLVLLLLAVFLGGRDIGRHARNAVASVMNSLQAIVGSDQAVGED